MNHIPEEYLYSYLLEQARLNPADASHLADCADCQARLVALRHLLHELTIARQSEPTPQVLARYRQLFAYVSKQPGVLTRVVQRVRAQLNWDSRQQPALQGLRNAGAPNYRQLYATDGAEIELMVANRFSQQRTIEGDIITQGSYTSLAPALIQLSNTSNQELTYEALSDEQGRFHVENVDPGHYQLTITPAQGALLEIDDLEIT